MAASTSSPAPVPPAAPKPAPVVAAPQSRLVSRSSASDAPVRLTSLDTYRGAIMLLLCSGGLFAIGSINSKEAHKVWASLRSPATAAVESGARDESAEPRLSWIEKVAPVVARQFQHVTWTGCTLWDLIQPSFMFMAGVSMPFSFARRKQLGESNRTIAGHTILRAGILIALGILLRSKARPYINVTFIDVVAQIGLAYVWVALCVGRSWWVQLLIGAAILGGDWYLYYQHPIPTLSESDSLRAAMATIGTKKPAEALAAIQDGTLPIFTGLAAHWNPGTCWGVWADAYFLNAFPRPEPIEFTDGGYSTFNFIPSIVTMLLGVMAGEVLRSPRTPGQKTVRLLLAGFFALALAMALDYTIWPGWLENLLHWKPTWTVCPIVKKIWTPTWVIFSAGWCFLLLAGFYFFVDVLRWKWWTYPLVVLGTNSIAIYCLSQVFGDWVKTALRGSAAMVLGAPPTGNLLPFTWGEASFLDKVAYCFASGFPGQTLRALMAFLIFWLILAAMYRRKLFVRI